MEQTWHGHFASRIKARDPFLSNNTSGDNGWSVYVTGRNSIQGGDR
jgi:hypothetical protein